MSIFYYNYQIHKIDRYILEAYNIIPKISKDYQLIQKIPNKFYIYIQKDYSYSQNIPQQFKRLFILLLLESKIIKK